MSQSKLYEILGVNKKWMSVNDILRHSPGLNKTTIHRKLHSMTDCNLLERQEVPVRDSKYLKSYLFKVKK